MRHGRLALSSFSSNFGASHHTGIVIPALYVFATGPVKQVTWYLGLRQLTKGFYKSFTVDRVGSNPGRLDEVQ